MDVREKLVELLQNAKAAMKSENLSCDIARNMFVVDFMMANGVTVQEWISVEDRLPEEKVDCIVHYKHAYCNNDGYWAIGFCFYDGEKFQFDQAYKVTHWMPTPQPPKGVNDAESVD